jgi:hypothetical protein
MGKYEAYIEKIKKLDVKFNEHKILAKIEAKTKAHRPVFQLAFAGVLLTALIFSFVYFNMRPFVFDSQSTLSDYLFQQEESGDNAVLSYVFTE